MVFIFTVTYSQEDMVVVDNTVFRNSQRPPAAFQHDKHNKDAGIEYCDECHHVYENGKKLEDESSEDKRCSECHKLKSSGSMLRLIKAFHTKCKGCHLKNKQGPIMCGECHNNIK